VFRLNQTIFRKYNVCIIFNIKKEEKMSIPKQSPIKHKRGKQSKGPSHSEVYLCIKLSEVLTFSARCIFQRNFKKALRLALKLALVLLVCQLLPEEQQSALHVLAIA
jgi:hypothetical protein